MFKVVCCRTSHPVRTCTDSLLLCSRLCPYPGLCLVMEVHGPGACHGPRRQEMMSLGWARLELFDLNSQLHRGYWKVPVRSLPVTPAKHQVDLVPQEMYQFSLVPVLRGNMNIP
ncbi:unnamed protein product [Gadus morhua 'NCC']